MMAANGTALKTGMTKPAPGGIVTKTMAKTMKPEHQEYHHYSHKDNMNRQVCRKEG
jgi:hypothetical protein|eukprot:CAMPEP_0174346224 /NCGR_PEP_ID=MMETSP0811_2-20130205/1872_1 /TAXON_ID=73025 ORGANISM="Eutreptiella gymnastica-like, Strain CCMP1594" /NCGR_SAMPLE_ID=MMETSP0811_2 /ASSEMBLY_ACC=CAM_ASM_000667 /LENGTH=55 /DNA_ID=CAMNT_0015470603 /DNA_START=60 /DNA_END=227 /DNA_ORIENTATION=-